jgi:hypothetical protein
MADAYEGTRHILITVDGTGALSYHHEGLSPVEVMGLLETVKAWAFVDLQMSREQCQVKTAPLPSFFERLRGQK